MTDLWTTLIPLAIATAVLPIQVAITILMLRSAGGRARAGGWIAGMTLVRLAQYAVFGLILERAMDDAATGTSPAEGALLLVVAVLLLVSAGRKIANQPDEDAPPPRWLTMVDGVTASRAFLMGAGLVALSPKLWAFTLGAIGAVRDAELDLAAGWVVFIIWLIAAESLHLIALFAALVAPARADVLLARAGGALERRSRELMIGVGLVFGIWFLLKALAAFGFGPGA
jgi:threonine/homoserine/homoserine lactone efflux protein